MRTLLSLTLLCTFAGLPATSPGAQSSGLHDTYLLKPPTGAKLAVYEFEDLECPKCAHDAALVHATCAKYGVPLVRKDYPWFFPTWAMPAAVNARYLQDHASPQLADRYRSDVFAAQNSIASREDLQAFTARWYAGHGQAQSFFLGNGSKEADEVKADHALGDRIGVHETPTILLVTADSCLKVPDASNLEAMLRAAIGQQHGAVHSTRR